jgi:streptomycin 6-kinase
VAHSGLERLARTEDGQAWLERLPRLRDECVDQWSLEVGEPFAYANASLALPARLPDGTEAVLKVGFPHRESEHEGDALTLWDGDGAVRLLARDPERDALLIERCVPGRHLSEAGPDVGLDVIVGLLPRLWKPAAEPFRPLAEEAAWWRDYLPGQWEGQGRPYERSLLDAALEALDKLPATQGEQVLLHQDLHGDNVLSAAREPWLAIDPKPLVGEREFGIAPVVRSYEFGHSRELVLRRFERLTGELALDAERARGWAIAQTLAWAGGKSVAPPRHVETARWLLEG